MSKRRLPRPPAEVRAVQELFGKWRERKRGREAIPERLWSAAVRLCKRHSVHRVSRWLRLNDTRLRERVKKQSATRERTPAKRRMSAPTFVEFLPSLPSRAEYVVEVEDAQGTRVRVRVSGGRVEDVAALAKLLRGARA